MGMRWRSRRTVAFHAQPLWLLHGGPLSLDAASLVSAQKGCERHPEPASAHQASDPAGVSHLVGAPVSDNAAAIGARIVAWMQVIGCVGQD